MNETSNISRHGENITPFSGLFKTGRRVVRLLPLYLTVLPTLILLIAFNWYPALSQFWHSLFDWTPGFPSQFVGVSNFVQAYQDSTFTSGFVKLFWLMLFGLIVPTLVVPFTAAEMLVAVRNPRTQGILKVALVIPMAFPGVVTLLLWGYMFDPSTGLIDAILKMFGMTHAINWLGNPHTALISLMLIGFPWVGGLPFLVYLAGLQSIPTELREAAVIDGASVFQKIVRIDIPLVFSQTRLLIILGIVGGIQNIVPMALLTQGGPAFSTMVPILWTFDQAFTYGMWGYACALAVILFVAMTILSVVAFRLSRSSSRLEADRNPSG
ncbi:MAG: carbohydrate ABC transporter permease [Bacilli bacterium]